jgi:phosphoenolpyruvate carboxykinase (ATP)
MARFDLSAHGITVQHVHRNLPPSILYEEAIRTEAGTTISDKGALIAYSGKKTGRSPKDKRIVQQASTERDVWWGPVNSPLDELTFNINRERAIDYLNTRSTLYCLDAFAGWDPRYRIKVRVISARPYHALFMHNMLIRPNEAELDEYGEPNLVLYNAGGFPANRYTTGMTSKTSVDLNLETSEVVILGTEYAGEMKKAVFTYMNYWLPKQGVLSMHCSVTADRQTGRPVALFGLSGTGKTTLSADPNRMLIGDDEHGWTESGIFNIEGGCYAKAVYLTREAEPQIFDALRFGAVLENVVYDRASRHVDFGDTSITENTRGAYPIEYIDNARIPCMASHPSDVIFLTCDAFGVLPPISRLNRAQAEYHFISGYTAKVAGTEVGVTEPEATFSPCFGGPFLVWHPKKYAALLSERIARLQTRVWLVNTGWVGGAYGTGHRIGLDDTRAMIEAIYRGQLDQAATRRDETFQIETIVECPRVRRELLWPPATWRNARAYERQSSQLALRFIDNFRQYADELSREVHDAGPRP